MTVKELRKKLEGVSDDLELVVVGYFGEGIRVDTYGWRVGRRRVIPYYWHDYELHEEQDVFEIPFTDRGESPN